MVTNDSARLRKELLIALRGRRSQAVVSEKLGFNFNKVYRWENGITRMSWLEFIDFARICGKPLSSVIHSVLRFNGPPENYDELVLHLGVQAGDTKTLAAAGISRHKVARWIHKKNSPTLEEMLTLIRLGSLEFFRFLEELGVIDKMPSLQEENRKVKEQASLHWKMPWVSAVLAAIDSTQYRALPRHSNEALEQISRIARPLLLRTLEALAAHGAIEFDGRSWRSTLPQIRPKVDLAEKQSLLRFWNSRAADALEEKPSQEGNVHGYQVFNLRQEDFPKIKECYHRFYNEISTIVTASDPHGSNLYAMTVHIFDLQVLPLMSSAVSTAAPSPGVARKPDRQK